MDAIELIKARRVHLTRQANANGAAGERRSITNSSNWIARPRGLGLRILLAELREAGAVIKASAFDAVASPAPIDFLDANAVRRQLADFTFIEITTATQRRVRPDFGGFFFAITEAEIAASDVLGHRHRIALFNSLTSALLLTSVPEVLKRARSTTWQLSVQL